MSMNVEIHAVCQNVCSRGSQHATAAAAVQMHAQVWHGTDWWIHCRHMCLSNPSTQLQSSLVQSSSVQSGPV